MTFTVEVTYASLCNVTNRFVTNQGVARSLCEKLGAAHGAAGANGRQGRQPGKRLTNEDADILIRLADGLSG